MIAVNRGAEIEKIVRGMHHEITACAGAAARGWRQCVL